jgi:hypothetical protein
VNSVQGGKALVGVQQQQQQLEQQQLEQGGLGVRPLVVANPLAAAERRQGGGAEAPSGSSRQGAWERVGDGAGDVWYVHSVTGESVWELPE